MTTTTRSVPRRRSSSDPSKKRVLPRLERSEKPRVVVARGEADPPAQRDGGRPRTARRRRSSAAKVECTALVLLRDNAASNQDDAEEPKTRPRRRHSTTERQKEEGLLQKEGKNGSARKLARTESKKSVVSEKSAGSSASSSPRRHKKKKVDDDALVEETPNEDIALFHFRRKESDGRLLAESTLKAQIDECMSDLVKRLQRDNERGASGVLTFTKREAAGLKSGQRRIVFSLKHAKGARFTKEEFGRMQANEILWMTKVRPLVVDIQTERCPEENDKGDSDEGEAIDVF